MSDFLTSKLLSLLFAITKQVLYSNSRVARDHKFKTSFIAFALEDQQLTNLCLRSDREFHARLTANIFLSSSSESEYMYIRNCSLLECVRVEFPRILQSLRLSEFLSVLERIYKPSQRFASSRNVSTPLHYATN